MTFIMAGGIGKRVRSPLQSMVSLSVNNDLIQLISGIAKNMTPLVFQKGQVLFYEGHIPFGFFVIKEGKVGFSSGKSQNETVEQVVGIQNVLSETPYSATCTAQTLVRAVFVPKSTVLDAAEKM